MLADLTLAQFEGMVMCAIDGTWRRPAETRFDDPWHRIECQSLALQRRLDVSISKKSVFPDCQWCLDCVRLTDRIGRDD